MGDVNIVYFYWLLHSFVLSVFFMFEDISMMIVAVQDCNFSDSASFIACSIVKRVGMDKDKCPTISQLFNKLSVLAFERTNLNVKLYVQSTRSFLKALWKFYLLSFPLDPRFIYIESSAILEISFLFNPITFRKSFLFLHQVTNIFYLNVSYWWMNIKAYVCEHVYIKIYM